MLKAIGVKLEAGRKKMRWGWGGGVGGWGYQTNWSGAARKSNIIIKHSGTHLQRKSDFLN